MTSNCHAASQFVATLSIGFALCVTAAIAQDDAENPPTLKLDRVMSLPAFIGQTRVPATQPSHYSVETLAGGLSVPWALAFLQDDEILITEYATGNMRVLQSDGTLSQPISGLPEFSHEGWAGLFDLTLDPDFASNQTLYFSYTAPSGNPANNRDNSA